MKLSSLIITFTTSLASSTIFKAIFPNTVKATNNYIFLQLTNY